MSADTNIELLKLEWKDEQPFHWAVGKYGSRFLKELRDNKRIMGIKCPKCGYVYVPLRKACGRCFVEMSELVEVGPRGKIESFTVCRFTFLDPETGVQRPVPYGYCFVKLDGSDSSFLHFLDETDISKIKRGMRVEAVFQEQRTGSMRDVKHFRIVEE